MKSERHGWAEFAGSIGAACLVAGYLRYSIEGSCSGSARAF